jgi:hypothetical protein
MAAPSRQGGECATGHARAKPANPVFDPQLPFVELADR